MIDLKVKIRAGASLVKVRPLFTCNSKSIIVASGSDIKVFSIQSGECIQTLRYHKKPVVSLQECKKNVLQILSCCEGGIVVRWDYSEGKLLQVYNGPISTVASFYAPNDTFQWFVTKKYEDHFRLYSLYPKTEKKASIQMVLKPVLPIQNTIAFGFKGKFVAAVYENNLTVYELEKKIFVRHKTGERMLKCIVCHPSDDVVATGDNQGRVLVWSDIFNSKKPIRSIYHWHTLPVADLVFSTEGSYLYSGGGEAALVKWNLFSEQKSIIPRLGSPICHLNISTDNSYVVSAHDDNALQIINSQRIVVQIIQGLTQGHFQGAKSGNLLPTGMVYDPRTRALVMNGRPGHLQFYNVTEDKQLFNLDITGRNFISQERESIVLNTDVHKTAIDDRGIWLATTEYWYDEETSPQLWLKFWEFDITKQTFVLNTNVILPHNQEVNCILFRPIDDVVSASPLAVTTSNDCKFKIWSLQQDANSDQKQTWTCTSMGCYRDLPAGDACFSEEGSLLAVTFGKAATLWTVDNTILKAVLCNDKSKRNIVQILFGRKSCCHLLVCHDGTSITVWDVLSLSIIWIVHTEVQIIVGDRASDVIAAFCQNQNLIVFRPNDPLPVYSLSNASKTPVISAVFVSKDASSVSEDSDCFYEKSQLYFFNEEQKLLTLTDEPDTELEIPDSTKKLIAQNIPKTPFGMLQAEHKISNVETVNPQPLTIHTKGDIKMMTIPCPTLQDPILLCSNLLTSFLIPKQNLVQ